MIKEAGEETIRKYLLGELAEEEQARLEESLMTDDDFFKLLEVVEDELIDDCLGGELSGEEQKRFDTYFLSTPERREKFMFAQTLREYVPRARAAESKQAEVHPPVVHRPVWWRQPFSNPYLRLAAAAVIVVGLVIIVWFIRTPRSEVSKGMAALKSAYRDQRPVESRITGFDYAQSPPITRGGGQEKFDYLARDRAGALIQVEALEHPDAQSYHDLGRLYLAKHEFDKAIEQFEKALKLDEKNAQIESDLGAALVEKSRADRLKDERGNSLEGFARAIEHLTRALALDGSSLEALFNRALCRQEMKLFQQAEEDWQVYLEKDSNSKWADEARQHLKELEERKKVRLQNKGELLPDFVGACQSKNDDKAYELMNKHTEAITGQLLWWQLLGAYMNPSLSRDSDGAGQYLQTLYYAGSLQEKKTGDRFISDLARIYGTSTADGRASLAQAHELINQAHSLLAQSETKRAFELYEKARDIFDKTGNELESQFASYYIGYCLYRKSVFKESLSTLFQVADYSKAKGYLWLRECALTIMANIHAESDQFSTSLAYYKESLEISKKINDEYNTQKNLTSLAYDYMNLGDRKESLAYMQRCLERAGDCWPGARQMYRNFDAAAEILNSFGYYTAAAEYEKTALQLAAEAGDPGLEHLSYTQLAAIYAKLQDYTEALRCAEMSYQMAKALSDKRTRLSPIALSSLQLGHIHRQAQDYAKATAYYDDAIKLCKEINLFAYLYEAHKGRLLCFIAQGDDSMAEEELQTVLAFFEEHRSKIREEKNRNSFFDLEQYVYDIAIDFEYSKKHYQKAFEYSEMSHARSLLDMMNAGAEIVGTDSPYAVIPAISRPLMLDSIREKMPKQAQILQYSVLDDKVLIWVISKTKFEVAEEKITPASLTQKALDYWQSISILSEAATEDTRRKAIELYDILIKPVESLLEKDKQICIIPDKALNYLPFNALISPGTDRYLIKDYVLSFAPSANIFLLCSEAARERSGAREERVLSVGDPHFNHHAFPGLSELTSSGKEAEEIARCYRSRCCLVGENASKARVRSEMGNADVIQLASHYVIDEHNPMLSKLLLTQEAGADLRDPSGGILQVYDIYQKKLPVTRLVVLSACRTGIEQYYKGEGMIGMSRTFLAAGVPLVVASLWPVDSDPTADLMISFHKYRKQGGLPSAEALRQAQLDMIDNSQRQYNRPYYWAPFVIIGGNASF